jgi:hypothetical protein
LHRTDAATGKYSSEVSVSLLSGSFSAPAVMSALYRIFELL